MFANLVTYRVHQSLPLPANDAIAYQYILAAGGVFVRAETRFWAATLPIARCEIRGLQPLQPQFRLKVPRLSQQLLVQVLADARRDRGGDGCLHEALYRFQHIGERVRVVKPAQQATATRVRSPGGDDPTTILELHSHGWMEAFFSRTDNLDEQGAHIYGVIGRVDGAPEIRLRLGLYGYWQPLPVTLLFDGDGGLNDIIRQKERSHEG
ncbi:MAG: Mov34/MPN/PAD-1 family protein [Chloroflexi bacterium]|nr:Mov34/MPN/PAD-1 family protein [Chloroflexota bacterium]MCI0581128.1 Mov34/MPN/PAD-1 family protein [Chloroflexota bacterium]MCI0649978.1 Mov34/MPN/PAD-1 family protein [Chloroflexota bacterium]MCI0727740.1 Mov34/MPN/PAD-1 family protein [Chloroflexota bacterium]